jgi:hypothetical protein
MNDLSTGSQPHVQLLVRPFLLFSDKQRDSAPSPWSRPYRNATADNDLPLGKRRLE